MEVPIPEALNIQTFIIVWDINLKIPNNTGKIDILTPVFSLNEKENTNWIRLLRFANKIKLESNVSSIQEFKECSTYMVDPLTCTLQDVYEGFGEFCWKQHEWSDRMSFVFEVKMQCDALTVAPTVWKRCCTEMRPAILTNVKPLTLDAEEATHMVVNNRGLLCAVKRCLITDHNLFIEPESDADDRNLLTVMLRKTDSQTLDWSYLHTTTTIPGSWRGRAFSKFETLYIFEIHELRMSVERVTDYERATVTSVIWPNFASSRAETSADISSDTKELQYMRKLSSIMKDYFFANKYCDIFIHVRGKQIWAHKIALSNGSTVWLAVFDADEQLEIIRIVDFDYETIYELITYIYTGKVKKVTEQLLSAADTYGVALRGDPDADRDSE